MSHKFPFLGLILLAYLALGVLFAVTTPPWQNPDEPAHYNYIAHIARGEGLPVLQMGDYDQTYLEQLTREKFPPHLPIEPVRYEYHQPPLFYLSAAPLFWLTDGNLLVLRLYSVVLGGGVMLLIFLTARTIFPDRPQIVLGATAFVAFLPMHVAMMAAVNNDPLAELIVAGAMYLLLRWIQMATQRRRERARKETKRTHHPPPTTHHPPSTIHHPPPTTHHPPLTTHHPPPTSLLLLGYLIGLGFLTKATTYVLLPVVLITVGAVSWRAWGWRRALLNAALVLPWALLLGLPLWLRNVDLYGGLDFLGLNWHDQVVAGQPTTAGWIAANGWPAYWQRVWRFTTSSFWGVFGWMGVFMDGRIYTALLILGTIAGVGIVVLGVRMARRQIALTAAQRWSLFALLALSVAVLAAYVWYNLGFIQHQGRYLFPALLPIGLLFAWGWSEVLRPLPSLLCAVFLLFWLIAGTGVGALTGVLDAWQVVLLGLAVATLLFNAALALRLQRWSQPQPLIYAAPFVLLAILDVAVPFLYIIPQLERLVLSGG